MCRLIVDKMIVYVLMLLFGRRYVCVCACVLFFISSTFAYICERLNFARIISDFQCNSTCTQKMHANFYAHDIFRHVTCHCNAKMIYSILIIAYPFMCFLHVRTFMNVCICTLSMCIRKFGITRMRFSHRIIWMLCVGIVSMTSFRCGAVVFGFVQFLSNTFFMADALKEMCACQKHY